MGSGASAARRHPRRRLTAVRRLRLLLAPAALAVILGACSAEGAAPSSEQPPATDHSGEPAPVEPQPGQQNVHPVALEQIGASASGSTITADLAWTSGVDPCFVLDQVIVHINDDRTVDITVREGTSDPDAICVMLAVRKHTVVSFDVPSTGRWTIRDAEGGAPPVEVLVT